MKVPGMGTCPVKPVMHLKPDLSSKMCRTRELFVTFRENQR